MSCLSSTSIPVVTNVVTSVASNRPPQFGLQADADMCPPPKTFTSPFLCVLLKAADPQNSWGGPFIRRISSPQLSHVAAGSLPIYYHCKSPPPSLRPAPRLFKTYTKTFLKGLVRGPWCHGDGFNNSDLFSFPLHRSISSFDSSLWRAHRGDYTDADCIKIFGRKGKSSAALLCEDICVKLISRCVKD